MAASAHPLQGVCARDTYGLRAEQAERTETPPALEQVAEPQRGAGPKQQLPPDHILRRPPIADDDHVIDQDLGSFGDGEADVCAGVVVPQRKASAMVDAISPGRNMKLALVIGSNSVS